MCSGTSNNPMAYICQTTDLLQLGYIFSCSVPINHFFCEAAEQQLTGDHRAWNVGQATSEVPGPTFHDVIVS